MATTDDAIALTVHVDQDEWRQIASLTDAGPDDRVFAVDTEGRVTFGDGAKGQRPPDGAAVTIGYRDGGGASGNVLVAITTPWPPAAGLYRVELGPHGIGISGAQQSIVAAFGARRLRYFAGQVLGAAELQDEQDYLRNARFRHNRALHGTGIATGLTVTLSTHTATPSVVVEPGLAIDRRGREVELLTPATVEIRGARRARFVTIEYAERDTGQVPGSADDGEMLASRVEEGAVLRLCGTGAVDNDSIVLAKIAFGADGWRVDGSFVPSRLR